MEERREDAEIAGDVREVLDWDRRLDATNIGVNVVDGVVTLSGTVATLGEKRIAIEDAWRVKGVRAVRDDLVVHPLAMRTDGDIAADVVNALRFDHRVDERHIRVHVADAIVTLTGDVGSIAEKRAAEEDAWYTAGVADVINELVVAPLPMRPDEDIEADVRAAITRDTRISDPTRISVDSVEGTVYLRGGVENAAERAAADDDAWFTAGVLDVVNELVIAPLHRPLEKEE